MNKHPQILQLALFAILCSIRSISPISAQKIDTVSMHQSFKSFVCELRNGSPQQMLQYVDLNDLSSFELTFMVFSDDEKELERRTKEHSAFTATDFIAHYQKIFPQRFIDLLAQVELDVLFSQGSYELGQVETGGASIPELLLGIDEHDGSLQVLHYEEELLANEEGDFQRVEFARIYQFRQIDGVLKLVKLFMAG